MKMSRTCLVAALLAVLASCASTPATEPTSAATDLAAPVASVDPRAKFKDGERLLRDLSYALDLPRESICSELSRYDCVNDAFRIVLGGVEGANLGVQEPLAEAALTAPIALDRVALHVCITRVQHDLDDPAHAVLLRQAKASSSGKLRKPDKAWLRQTASGLYGTILSRDATPSEAAELVAFYADVSSDGGKANPDAVKDWVTLGCFAVASSLESIFY